MHLSTRTSRSLLNTTSNRFLPTAGARISVLNFSTSRSFATPSHRTTFRPNQNFSILQKRNFATSPTTASFDDSKSDNSNNSNSSNSNESFFKSKTWTNIVGTVGAIANWGIPLAALNNMRSSENASESVDPKMSATLAVYSMLFMRWAIAITPPNYPLLICHICNASLQSAQVVRWMWATYGSDHPQSKKSVLDLETATEA